jgi:3-hydroxyacyl-[acyl-carrier-protein] dehydratase
VRGEKLDADSTYHSSHLTDHILQLPHRPPFVFVRKLNACEPGVSAECETSFSPNEPMFAGHFPGDPLVPGVILTEALAQTAGIAAASTQSENSQPKFLLSAIRQMKFFEPVRPDQKIILRARKLAEISGLLQFKVEADVDQKRVAEGELVLSAI